MFNRTRQIRKTKSNREKNENKIDLQIAQRVETSEGALANSSQLVVAQIPAKHGKGKENHHQSVGKKMMHSFVGFPVSSRPAETLIQSRN